MESTHHSQTVHPTHVPLFNTGTLVFSDVTRPKWLFRQKCVKAEGRRDRDSGKKGTRGEARGQRPKTNEIRRERVSGKKKKKKGQGGREWVNGKERAVHMSVFLLFLLLSFFFSFFFLNLFIYLILLLFFFISKFCVGQIPVCAKGCDATVYYVSRGCCFEFRVSLKGLCNTK